MSVGNQNGSNHTGTISAERLTVLGSLMDQCKPTLSVDQQGEVWHLLLEFSEVFSINEMDTGRTDLISHRIETTDRVPIKYHQDVYL